MTVITAGALKIKAMLPKPVQARYDVARPLDKKGIKTLINNLINYGGDDAFPAITELSNLFFGTASDIGSSTPLSDYENDSEEKKAIIDEFEHKVVEIMKGKGTKQEKLSALNELAAKTAPIAEKQNLSYLLSRGSIAGKMAQTGARGNPSQLSQGTFSPLLAQDVKGNPIPVAITHSFAEGLSPAETFAMSFGGRASTVLSQLSTQKPGELFKRLTPTLFHEVVSMEDCHTKNGIPVPAKDALQVIGRVLSGSNTLVTEQVYASLPKEGMINIRSPLTCEAKEGVCQKCYGLAANGHFPEIGTNVGVLASQSISETLTQAMLSTKHQGGVAGRQRNAYDEAANLLNNPRENFLDEATISTKHGLVTKIVKDDLNNHQVYVENTPHFVDRFQKVKVSAGDSVDVGDPLSTGVINTRKLAALLGTGHARKSLMESLREVYSRKTPLDPKHFEVVARNLVNFAKVISPGSTNAVPGDVLKVKELHSLLKTDESKVPLDHAEGKTLSEYVSYLTPGTELSAPLVRELKRQGVSEVKVSNTGLKTEPLVPGLQTSKLLDKNWISRLAFSKLSKSIQDAASLSESSAVHSYEPITPYMMGNEFGEGEHGKY